MARKLQHVIRKERGLEARIYTTREFGEEYIEIHDVVDGQEVPGFVCNVKHLPALLDALHEVKRFVTVSSGSEQCEGQGVLF